MRVFMAPDYRQVNPYQELLKRSLVAQNVEVVFPVGYKRGLPFLRGIRSAGGQFQVIHLHWLSPYLKSGRPYLLPLFGLRFIFDLMLCRYWLGCRIIWTVHNLASHENATLTESFVRKAVARIANAVIVHSQSARNRVVEAYGIHADSIHIVPHGQYREWYGDAPPRDEARARLGLDQHVRLYLFLGLLRSYKGLEDLLQAWKRISPSGASLVIAGEPIDQRYLHQLEQLAVGDHGIALRPRRVPDEEMAVWLSAADVFVLPLKEILTSGSLVLAQSYGLPVVAPAHPLVKEVLGAEAKYLYPPDAADGLQAALQRTLDLSPARNTDQGTSWSSVAGATVKAYSA